MSDKSNTSAESEAKIDFADIKRKSLRGGAVTLVSQGAMAGIQLISTAILARLLSAVDYGTIAMVLAITSFAVIFRDLGLSSAAIQKKNLTDAQQSNLFWLNVALGASLTAIVGAASPLVAWFYGKPELIPVTIALSFSFLIGSLGSQHTARLTRDMQFTRKAGAAIAGSLISLGVAVACALNGLAYWSLVWGNLAGAAVTSLLVFLLSPFWPGWYRKGAGIRSMLGFGANVTAFNVVNYFSRNLDNILIGKYWGSGELGIYTKGYSLLMMPVNMIRGPINAVAFPALSRLQGHPLEFRSYFLKTTTIIAWMSMAVAGFFWVASETIIRLLLGPDWHEVGPIFSWLAIAAFIQPSSGFVGSLTMSLGMGKRHVICGIYGAFVVVTSILVGIHWGALGVAKAYGIANICGIVPFLWIALRNTPVSQADFYRSLFVPALVAILGATLASAFHFFVQIHNQIIELLLLGFVFSAPYIIVFVTRPSAFVSLLGTIKSFQRPKSSSS